MMQSFPKKRIITIFIYFLFNSVIGFANKKKSKGQIWNTCVTTFVVQCHDDGRLRQKRKIDQNVTNFPNNYIMFYIIVLSLNTRFWFWYLFKEIQIQKLFIAAQKKYNARTPTLIYKCDHLTILRKCAFQENQKKKKIFKIYFFEKNFTIKLSS